MANADFERIKARITEILNACPSGTFSAVLSAQNKTRSAAAISAAATEAALTVLTALASMPNEYRTPFITPVTINHGDFLPDHLGAPAKIEIQRYDGAAWREADTTSKNYQQIEAFRQLFDPNINLEGNVYDSIPHNTIGSSLAGFADIWENKFYFTGFAARVGLANVSRADVTAKIPETMESTVIKLGVGNCVKAGDGGYTMQMANYYTSAGMNDLAEFKAGRRQFAEVSAPAPQKEVHQS